MRLVMRLFRKKAASFLCHWVDSKSRPLVCKTDAPAGSLTPNELRPPLQVRDKTKRARMKSPWPLVSLLAVCRWHNGRDQTRPQSLGNKPLAFRRERPLTVGIRSKCGEMGGWRLWNQPLIDICRDIWYMESYSRAALNDDAGRMGPASCPSLL